MIPRIVIDSFPMPPSANALYSGGRFSQKSRRWKSDEYNFYLSQVAGWATHNYALVKKIRDIANEAMAKGFAVRVDTYFCFPEDSLFCKSKKAKDRVKELDASNRIKAAHDTFAKIIQVDDRHFWAGWYEKVTAPKPTMIFVLTQFKPRNIDEINHALALETCPDET